MPTQTTEHIRTFAELGTSKEVVEALAHRDILTPFAIQALVLEDGISGRDVLAKSRTGSGKTLAFAIPIVERIKKDSGAPAALVLVPTRELASQVAEELVDISKAKGLRVAVAYGGTSLKEQAAKAKGAQILVATPGRLEDYATRGMVDLSGVKILVLDEADRMLDMGFLPQVAKIAERVPSARQTMFFSATLDGEVGRIAKAFTHNPAQHEVVSPTQTVDEVNHRFIPVKPATKVDTLVEVLAEERELALVFVRTKRGADRLVDKLKARHVKAEAMHGDMQQRARERALAKFESGKSTVLVATDVAARGLDLDAISHVINFDPPEDDKAYVHRVGRTARAGRSGTGITLILPDQQGDVSRIASRLKLEEPFKEAGMTVIGPRLVYSARSRGRNSLLGRRPRRRF